jgi:hydrogenase 3 maturation protease
VQNLKADLKLKLKGAKKIAILGVGSELRGDDVAGVLVAKHLEAACSKSSCLNNCKVFIGETAPENLTGEIKRFKPGHIIIIDSAEMGKAAGAVQLIDPDEAGGFSFCTHNLPVKIMVDYLVNSIGCEIFIIGIQPKKISFGTLPSKEIIKSARQVCSAIKACIK